MKTRVRLARLTALLSFLYLVPASAAYAEDNASSAKFDSYGFTQTASVPKTPSPRRLRKETQMPEPYSYVEARQPVTNWDGVGRFVNDCGFPSETANTYYGKSAYASQLPPTSTTAIDIKVAEEFSISNSIYDYADRLNLLDEHVTPFVDREDAAGFSTEVKSADIAQTGIQSP